MKQNLVGFLFIFFISNSLYAQELVQNKWQFGLFLTPKIDFRILQTESSDEQVLQFITESNKNDKVRLGLDVGIAGFYKINKRWLLKTGLEYSQFGFYYGGTSPVDTTASGSTYPVTYFQRSEDLIKYSFIKIPIGIRYSIINDYSHIWPFFEANIKPAFQISVFQNFEFYTSVSTTLGLSIYSWRHDQIYFGLTVDYFLKGIDQGKFVVRPFSIGLETGLIF